MIRKVIGYPALLVFGGLFAIGCAGCAFFASWLGPMPSEGPGDE